jgi:UMF1 family MFS transporter
LPIILENLWHSSDTTKTLLLFFIFITSILGSIVGGHLADRFGSKKTLIWVIIGWSIILLISALVPKFSLYALMAIIAGILFGVHMTTARALISQIAPSNHYNLTFALFTVVEKASIIIGPMLWGLTIFGFSNSSFSAYKLATILMSLIVIISLPILLRAKQSI